MLSNADMDGNGRITLQEYLRLKADTMTSHQLYLSALFEVRRLLLVPWLAYIIDAGVMQDNAHMVDHKPSAEAYGEA